MGKQPAAAVMRDVARLAGVSHQTVSRVLNYHPNVREETRERVLRAVRQLNYRPNALARGLTGRRSRAIGVVAFDTTLYGPTTTVLGVERAAHRAGYTITIVAPQQLDPAGIADAVSRLAEQSVAGVVVIAPMMAAARAARLLPAGLPTVVVEPDANSRLPTVCVDQVAGARLAVEHLLSLGHETVWHLSGPHDWREARDRIEGWRQALKAARRHVPLLLTGDWSPRSGYTAGRWLAGQAEVTAVFSANDQQALGLLRAFHEAGIRVPDQISVVGFDDIPEAAYLSPPLTTVRQDFDEVGRRCLATLLELLDGEEPAPEPLHSRVVPTLVARASSGPPPRG